MARKQKELAGMETASGIPEVDAAAERLRAASKKRKAAQDAEVEAKALLMQLMKDNKLKIYEDHDSKPPLVVTIAISESVHVEELREGGGKADPDEEEIEEATSNLSKLEQKASKKSTPDAAA